MRRQLQLVADGLVYYALNRGNNRARVFSHGADFQQFLHALAQTKERYPFRLYAYCLMDNHFHLVLEPAAGQAAASCSRSPWPIPGITTRHRERPAVSSKAASRVP